MVRETTPPKMTQMLKGLCYDLNSDNPPLWVKVVPENWALMNECFSNVQKKIAKDGGSFVNGWVLWQWANMMIEAEAHSVWKNRAGELIDITPHNYDEHTILFVPDTKVKFEGIIIPSKRAPMTTSPKVNYLIDLCSAKDHILQQSGSSKVCAFPGKLLLEIQKVIADITQKVPHNAPCPCGSGLKYKNCCAPYESL